MRTGPAASQCANGSSPGGTTSGAGAVTPSTRATALVASTRPWPLSNDEPPEYGAPKVYWYAVEVMAASTCAGVAPGAFWNSCATMPAMCGAAIDVPLMVL